MKRRFVALAALLLTIGATAAASAGAGAAPGAAATFRVGAAVESFTPPPAGAAAGLDPAACAPAVSGVFPGPRQFAFEEPYIDQQRSGHYDLGDPFVDCNHNGRWDGNFLGGGGNSPRFYDHVADEVGARAMIVTNGARSVAIEVVDQEGLFNVYADRIRRRVAGDGYRIGDIQISATHDESAPDSLGLYGPSPVSSSVNQYFVDYLVQQSAKAIEDAYNAMRPATIRYAQATEPSNLRQCWSSYPYIDDPLMPVMQAVGTDGKVIATLASVSQHTESLGFNGGSQLDNGYTLDQENRWVSSDWPHFFRAALEQAYGGVGIEMAGSVGSVETPQVFASTVAAVPQQYYDASHPAGCRTTRRRRSSGKASPVRSSRRSAPAGPALAVMRSGRSASQSACPSTTSSSRLPPYRAYSRSGPPTCRAAGPSSASRRPRPDRPRGRRSRPRSARGGSATPSSSGYRARCSRSPTCAGRSARRT